MAASGAETDANANALFSERRNSMTRWASEATSENPPSLPSPPPPLPPLPSSAANEPDRDSETDDDDECSDLVLVAAEAEVEAAVVAAEARALTEVACGFAAAAAAPTVGSAISCISASGAGRLNWYTDTPAATQCTRTVQSSAAEHTKRERGQKATN